MKTLIYDVETTGLSSYSDEILQLSIIDDDGNVLFNEYIKPVHKKKWDKAMKVHGISPAKVSECHTIDFYTDKIKAIFDNYERIVGYNNINFDNGFLERIGIDFSNKIQYDVMLEFAEIYGKWNDFYGDYKWQKLDTCAAYYDFDWSTIKEGAHNSLGDCYATLHCFKKMNSDE